MYMQSSSPEVLGTKIPATVVFAIGILLFLMPFAELKCNKSSEDTNIGGFKLDLGGQVTISNTGLGLAIGKEWDTKMDGLGGLLSGEKNSFKKDQPKQDPNYYAIAALALGIIGLAFCLLKFAGANWIAMIAAVLSAAALVGLKFDLDKKAKDPVKEMPKSNDMSSWGLDSLNAVNFKITYTPWFYIALIAMLVAAVFCYLRMKNSKTG
jgi:hypothetical protein